MLEIEAITPEYTDIMLRSTDHAFSKMISATRTKLRPRRDKQSKSGSGLGVDALELSQWRPRTDLTLRSTPFAPPHMDLQVATTIQTINWQMPEQATIIYFQVRCSPETRTHTDIHTPRHTGHGLFLLNEIAYDDHVERTLR